MPYPKIPYALGNEHALLYCDRPPDQLVRVKVRRELPGNVIVIHGVNDVGTSFAAVEQGLCQGLNARMYDDGKVLRPASYRLPATDDKNKLEADPDAVYFKRKLGKDTNSPVIPFYWRYRERSNASKMVNGQTTDRYGNRLDKDMAKNGGPFGNATNTLPDMWNRGLFSPLDLGGDPVRPLMTAPGRMYMVLAAQRLAALIAMIRDYDKNDVVSIVAHSQGCLISLLAQAFLFDAGKRPADTLILTHPPYSLVEDTSMFFGAVESSRIFGGGKDAVMNKQYYQIHARQTLHARLQTLAQIVRCVVSKKHDVPAFDGITDHTVCHGMAGSGWRAEQDRDNRGKVYLYFCPEDMTVALDNMQGIGWQGIPDFIGGHALSTTETQKGLGIFEQTPVQWKSIFQRRQPLQDIGTGFFQRIFTNKQRINPASGKAGPVLVGQAPHDYAPRLEDEDDHDHAAGANRSHRSRHDEAPWPPIKHSGWNIFQLKSDVAKACAVSLAKPWSSRLPPCSMADKSMHRSFRPPPAKPGYPRISKGRAKMSIPSMRRLPFPARTACACAHAKSLTIHVHHKSASPRSDSAPSIPVRITAPSVSMHANKWNRRSTAASRLVTGASSSWSSDAPTAPTPSLSTPTKPRTKRGCAGSTKSAPNRFMAPLSATQRITVTSLPMTWPSAVARHRAIPRFIGIYVRWRTGGCRKTNWRQNGSRY